MATDFVTATTKLQAVNVMLTNIGETPVASLEDEQVIDAAMAESILDNVTRETQTQSWHWNTDIQIKLSRNLDNRIVLAPNVMRIAPSGVDAMLAVVQRGRYLYNRGSHSYTFDHDITCDVTIALPFDELPEVARRYVTLRSARMFQERMISSDRLSQMDRIDEFKAYSDMLNEESKVGGYNALTGNFSAQRIVNRYGFTGS